MSNDDLIKHLSSRLWRQRLDLEALEKDMDDKQKSRPGSEDTELAQKWWDITTLIEETEDLLTRLEDQRHTQAMVAASHEVCGV